MNYEVLEALGRITREKNVDREVLLETLAAGLVSAGKKRYGQQADIVAEIDREKGTFELYLKKKVVPEVTDPVTEVTPEEARQIDPRAKGAEEVRIQLDVAEFGRSAIQAAKQVFVQRVREAERERVYDDYIARVGEVVTGTVQQVERGRISVNIGRVEALLPAREQIPSETLRQGDTLRALVLDVQKTTKGPQIILSRAHPDFVRRLFEMEVPEIDDNIVEIKAIAREAGGRSKVAVLSREDRVDAVGACVGMKGSRVQSVVRELNGERIDIVPWSSDAVSFVQRALSPAKVSNVEVVEPEHLMRVVVANDQLSLAIGKGGQNARLAAKLVGWKIDLISMDEFQARKERKERSRVPVEALPGIGEKLVEKLIAAGLETAQELIEAGERGLMEIQGIGPKSVEKILAVAQAAQREVDRLEAERALSEEIERARAAALGAAVAAPAPAAAAAAPGAAEPAEEAEATAGAEPLAEAEPAGGDLPTEIEIGATDEGEEERS